MPEKLKAVIVGYGKMGKIRAQSVLNHPDLLTLAGVSDCAEGIQPPKDVAFYSDHQKLIDCKPDIAFACTPNVHLPEITTFFLNHGVHVFCEKPPGCSKEDVLSMIKAERANPGLKLKFGFNHRYHEPIMEAKALIDKGRLGKLMWVRGIYGKSGAHDYEKQWRNKKELSGGGILIDQGIHMLDLFRLFLGEFDEVKSFVGRHYWPVDVEDNVFSLLRAADGRVAMLHSSATQWQHKFLLDLYLEKGYLSISGILSSTKTYGAETLRIARCVYDQDGYPLPNPEETVAYYDEDRSWALEVDEFVDCILRDQPIRVGHSQDALKTMELVERIYQSDSKWQPGAVSAKENKHEKSRLAR